ncbi:hypothetical protein JHL17_25495 [Azospirillum sp. YIM B02556]|uniref:Helicase-associated domain-containing protein n=1 Tax=Azospirillum endophyticum TaxID=2800326 RepID=A0ABS1FBF7_9PROT|nr:hypothetical protein [Azospirillum endophyticum]MBK1840763.1 hypothetical protein [Azospirillum endophyticum]
MPGLLDALRRHGGAVLQVPPGVGKTVRVPPALLEQPWLPGHRIVVVTADGLAARAACLRMAALLGEEPGCTVGFHTLSDSVTGPRMRIELLPAILFLRRIQDSPELADVGAVLFDCFGGQRTDGFPGDGLLGAAFAREAREALCGRTLLLGMTAAASPAASLASLLGGGTGPVPVVSCAGAGFPVEIRSLDALAPGAAPGAAVEMAMAAAIRRALREERGGVLAVLPDGGAVRRVVALLWGLEEVGPDILLLALCDEAASDLPAAVSPAPPGLRKLVLATPSAEAGLGIADVRIVVDCGLTRLPRHDRRRGMAHPVTRPAGRNAAERRVIAAGRQEPGVCYRLSPPCALPELPAPEPPPLELALEMAAWGEKGIDALPHGAHASSLLALLGAVGVGGAVTPLGQRMARLSLHPRLARLILCGAEIGLGGLACTVAAWLAEPDHPSGGDGADLRGRIDRLLTGEDRGDCDPEREWPILERAQAWRRRIGIHQPVERSGCDRIGELLALAYPDRVARRRSALSDDGAALYGLADGSLARLPAGDPLAAADRLAVAFLDGSADAPWIALAAALPEPDRQRDVTP